MSALFGWADVNRPRLLEKFERLRNSLATLKTAYEDCYVNDQVGIGRFHHGLLFPSSQPVWSRSRRTALFLDGYLFLNDTDNFSTFERKSEEVLQKIVEAYEEKGIPFIREIRGGIFNLLILDDAENKLYILNDRLGLLPLYYFEEGGAFGFSPLARPLAESGDNTEAADEVALSELLLYGWMVGERTAYKRVKLMGPASILTYDLSEKTLHKETYDRLHHQRGEKKGSHSEWLEQMDDLFRTSMNRYRGSSGRYGLMLSGGVDSRLILEYFSPKEKLKGYVFGGREYDDSLLAEKVAREAKIEYRLFDVGSRHFLNRYESAFAAIESLLAWWTDEAALVMREEGCGLCFDGIYGDGFFGGYYYQHFNLKNALLGFQLTPYRNLRQLSLRIDRASRLFTDEFLNLLLRDGFLESIQNTREGRLQDIEEWLSPLEESMQYEEEGEELFKLCDMRRRVSNLQGIRVRRYLEIAYPFCDDALINFSFSLPMEARANYRLYFAFLKHLKKFRTLRIPYDKTMVPADAPYFLQLGGIVGQKARHAVQRRLSSLSRGKLFPRRKLFMDFDLWLRTDPAFREVVTEFFQGPYFDPDKVGLFMKRWMGSEFFLEYRMEYLLSFALSCRAASQSEVLV
ncbi:MAG: hypothetical protein HY590_04180 [Candidatus Omnitrophica bacterium]|nr:hypothetical protein [Candidatus Omnitrophota bacterium]